MTIPLYSEHFKPVVSSAFFVKNSCFMKFSSKFSFLILLSSSSASLSGSYSTFDVLNYTGSVSGSYISGAAESSNLYVSGSSQFRSTNYNGYVSGTYGAGIPITSSLTNYNGVV